MCLAVYTTIEDLVFEIILRQKFNESSKHLIEHLWTLDNWDSIYAVWLNEIELSESVPIYIFKREYQSPTDQQVFVGTLDDIDTNCIPGVFAPFGNSRVQTPFDQIMDNGINRAIDWMLKNYGENIASGSIY